MIEFACHVPPEHNQFGYTSNAIDLRYAFGVGEQWRLHERTRAEKRERTRSDENVDAWQTHVYVQHVLANTNCNII